MSFLSDIQRFADATESTIDQSVRAIRLQAVELVIEKMPVDTGQARGSVQAAIGSPASGSSVIDNSSGTSAAVARAQGSINAPSNNIFYFTTNLPYVKYLENGGIRGSGPKITTSGYSTQAPQGMFKISAIQLKEHIREIIRNANT